jgi:CRISPR/Cas system-associated exonuclease Cas4 (RecB family)
MPNETQYLSKTSKSKKIPEYSLTGDLLSFLRCGLQYRYHNKGSLPPSTPVQLWFGEFIHGVMEQAYNEWKDNDSKKIFDWDWEECIRPIEMDVYEQLNASGIRPSSNLFCHYDESETRNISCKDSNHPHKRIGSRRAELSINTWGKHLFPLINKAEIKLKDIQPMPNYDEKKSRSKYYGITGIIDVISSINITDAPSGNLIITYLKNDGLFKNEENQEYEIIIDYKGMKRPSLDEGTWDYHEWQILTYSMLRSKQPDSKRIIAGIIFYLNELELSEENMLELKSDVRNSSTDIMPDKHDFEKITRWKKRQKIPNLSSAFREKRSIRIIKVEEDKIRDALHNFENTVEQIESAVNKESNNQKIKEAWPTPEEPRESDCTVCDFKTICSNPNNKKYKPTVP